MSECRPPPSSIRRGRRSARAGRCRSGSAGVFLTHLSSGWSAKHAAEAAGRNVRRFYDLREADGEFAEAWSRAVESGTQVLEDEARRRALDGWDDPSSSRGSSSGMSGGTRTGCSSSCCAGGGRRCDRDSASTLAVSGVVGVAAAIEDRSASLADVARVLRDVGAFEGWSFRRGWRCRRAT